MPDPITARRRATVWLLLVALGGVLLLMNPTLADSGTWRAWLTQAGSGFVLLALLLQWTMALLMIPTLPLVAALAWMLPDQPLLALGIAMGGVLGSALAIHVGAERLGLAPLLAASTRLATAREWIARHGSPALALWCLTPFLPSDVGCYVAASARMPLPRFLLAVLAGEFVLCASVIYGVAALAA
ncbi:MAG: hypothetical protein MUE46_05805 [Xanthomonadales bacterium]|nr:hypothetical protein [Xanthomonadales bacterium]